VADPRAVLAARNNAEWCDLVCRANGIATTFHADAWVSARRSPPAYPDAITLTPAPDPTMLLARTDSAAGCSVKDSFAALDLSAAGMRVLFEAEWICRPAAEPAAGRHRLAWREVRTAGHLRSWAAAHGSGGVFHPGLLSDPRVAILAIYDGDGVAGGLIANRSAQVVGVSNVFSTGDADRIWPEVAAVVSARFPGLPLVGYEHGPSRDAAAAAGFAGIGPLRIWLRD
jgi:hypothetical protein